MNFNYSDIFVNCGFLLQMKNYTMLLKLALLPT